MRIDTVVVSTQHCPDVSATTRSASFVIEQVVKPVLPAELVNGDITYHINPTGRFVVGGPHGDCGLTGGRSSSTPTAAGAVTAAVPFSGKDPTKVDRSAAYMARHVAKNIVAAGLADRCEVQLAYAIGVTEPVSVHVDTEGTGKIDDERICKLVREVFPLSPRGIIEYLDLRRPIYRRTAPVVTSAAMSSLGKRPTGPRTWPMLPHPPAPPGSRRLIHVSSGGASR